MHHRMFSCIPHLYTRCRQHCSPLHTQISPNISWSSLVVGVGKSVRCKITPQENHCFRPKSITHQRALGGSTKCRAVILITYRQDFSKSPLLITSIGNVDLTIQLIGNIQYQSILVLCSCPQGIVRIIQETLNAPRSTAEYHYFINTLKTRHLLEQLIGNIT